MSNKALHPTATRVTPPAGRFAPAGGAPRAAVGELERSLEIMSNLSRFKADLDKLLKLGDDLHLAWVIDN